jgi:hypothetical protein
LSKEETIKETLRRTSIFILELSLPKMKQMIPTREKKWA